MKMQLLLAVLLLHILSTQAEVFTALATLSQSLEHERSLAAELRRYVEAETLRLEQVLKVAQSYEDHAEEAMVDAERYIANPINAYLFVKKFTADMDHTKELLSSKSNMDAYLAEFLRRESDMPDNEDLEGVISAVLRLQDTYALSTREIVEGTFTPINRSPRLSGEVCTEDSYNIGKHAYFQKDYYHSLLWMNESLSLVDIDPEPTIDKGSILDHLAFTLFEHAYENEDFHHMLLWMQESRRILQDEVNQTVPQTTVLDYLSFALARQGNSRRAMEITQEWLKLDPTHERAISNMAYFQQMEDNGEIPKEMPPLSNERTTDWYRQSAEFLRYEALCRGEDLMPNPNAHKLKCYYTTSGNNPLLILAPVKAEEYYLDPLLILYHDVISDNEIAIVKKLATPRLDRATVNDPATGKLVYAHYRVSRSAWLKDEFHETVAIISRRISAITHLSMEKAEELQVVNYGIGGQYEPHYDHARKRGPEQNTFQPEEGNRIATWIYYTGFKFRFMEEPGNRIATWIYYFSEPDAGGYTVFTEIGAKVPPTKGSAAFWYNLLPSGEGDWRTRHAGCPVLAGSKWVANKWIHERGQEFMRPCQIQEDVIQGSASIPSQH